MSCSLQGFPILSLDFIETLTVIGEVVHDTNLRPVTKQNDHINIPERLTEFPGRTR